MHSTIFENEMQSEYLVEENYEIKSNIDTYEVLIIMKKTLIVDTVTTNDLGQYNASVSNYSFLENGGNDIKLTV